MNTQKGGFLLLLFFLLLFPNLGISRMRETPKSFTVCCKALLEVELKCTPQNNKSLSRQEVSPPEEDSLKLKPFIFAEAREVRWNPCNSGTWEKLSDGSKLWRLRILSSGAKSLNLGITGFFLPASVKLWIYNFKADYVEGPYEDKHKTAGQLWTPIIPGEQMVVEIYVPAGINKDRIRVYITKVNHEPFFTTPRLPCNIDTVCPEAEKWRDQIRSVALFTLDGTMRCSGVLLNNTRRDFTPYLLTADHADVNCCNAHTMVIYWNYQSPNCSKCRCNDLPGILTDNQTGAVFRAGWNDNKGSDFALVELKARPDPRFNVYYSGWDATGKCPASAIGIHYPANSEKSINFSGCSIISTDKEKTTPNPVGHYWCVERWKFGIIQDGSSGSGLWDACTGLCVGQLWGGCCRECNEKDPCKPKRRPCWYGKFSAGWKGGGTPETQLKYWLDPCGTDKKTLSGADPLCKEK